MPVNLLRDASVQRVSLVRKGANRKRFYLLKAEATEGAGPLPAGRIVKAADWSAAYVVVAEPGWHENPGQGAPEPDIDDRWADEGEIRKAAHSWMRGGGQVNRNHEGDDPYGQTVESFIAPADFEVGDETIAKDSWVIAIEPTEEGRDLIDKGEITGVSIEGTGVRELVEKGSSCPECGYPMATDTTCGKCDFVAKGSTSDPPTVGNVEKSLLKKIAEAVGIKAEVVEEIEKSDRTFGEIIAQREFDKALPDAFDAFREAVWNALFPCDSETADPVALITESCDEFKAWSLDQLESVPIEKAERAEALGVDLPVEGSTQSFRTKDGEMSLSDKERQEFDGLKKQVDELPEKVGDAFAARFAKALGANVEDEAPTPESIAKQVKDLKGVTDEDEIAKKIEAIEANISKLAEGGSAQPGEQNGGGSEPDAEALKKSFESEGVNPNLAGVLG